jgi:hypothetical protein
MSDFVFTISKAASLLQAFGQEASSNAGFAGQLRLGLDQSVNFPEQSFRPFLDCRLSFQIPCLRRGGVFINVRGQ